MPVNGSGVRSANRLARPSHCGKGLNTPQYFGLGAQGGMWCFGKSQIPRSKSQVGVWDLGFGIWDFLSSGALRVRDLAHVEQTLRVREQRHRELQLRIALHQAFARGLDAEQIEIDLVADHRLDE